MKLSVWLTVSDLVNVHQTLVEKINDAFDKKHRMFQLIPHNNIFQPLKEAGVAGIELLIPFYCSDENLKEVEEILKINKIPVFSIHQSLSQQKNIELSEIEKLCRIANRFSSKVIVLHAGSLGEKLFDSDFISCLKILQRKHKITFGIENMEKRPLLKKDYLYKSAEFSTVIKDADLSITFDITHLAQVGEDIFQFYLTNKKRVINIHLSDYKKSWINKHFISQINTHLALGKGNLPIELFLKTLKKNKYNGLITMEINDNLENFIQSAKIIKNCVG